MSVRSSRLIVQGVFILPDFLTLFPEIKRGMEEEMATHSSILARKILWTGDPREL